MSASVRLYPAGRVLTLHMVRTGGWCVGDPIAVNDSNARRILRGLASKGLVEIDEREECAVFTPAGHAWAESYWQERAVLPWQATP